MFIISSCQLLLESCPGSLVSVLVMLHRFPGFPGLPKGSRVGSSGQRKPVGKELQVLAGGI